MTHIGLRILTSGVACAALISRYVFQIEIDGISVGLLCLAFLPWLAPLIKSVEIPGVGKIEMQELKAQTEEAKGAALSAAQKAELALANAPPVAVSRTAAPLSGEAVMSEWDSLAAEYNDVRRKHPAGAARTSFMTMIVSKLTRLAPLLTNYNLTTALQEQDGGKRLAAYAFLYSRPDERFRDALVSSVVDVEATAFGQYWGIQAIQRVLSMQARPPDSKQVANKLRALLSRIETGSDRHYELMKVIKQLEGA